MLSLCLHLATGLFSRKPYRWLVVIFLLAIPGSTVGQTARKTELGFPNFRIHSTREIGVNLGSQFVSLDTNGRILFSSGGELSAFDGTQWNRVSIPIRRANEDMIQIATGPDKRIYVGGLAYWGRLQVDSRGRYIIDSFASEVEQAEFSVETFEEIAFCEDHVFYKGVNTLVRWGPEDGSTVWRLKPVDTIFEFENSLYLTNADGLYKLEGDEIVPHEASELLLANYGRGMKSIPWSDGRIALFTSKRGFVLFDGTGFEDIVDDFENSDQDFSVNDIQRVDENTIAISIPQVGLSFVDSEGRTILNLNKNLDYRFLDCGQIAIAPDKTIWVTLSDGVAQILSPLAITYFDQRLNVPLNYFEIARLNGDLVIRANGQIYKASYSENGGFNQFEPSEFLKQKFVHRILGVEDAILASTEEGLFRITKNGETEEIFSIPDIERIHQRVHGNSKQFILTDADNAYILEAQTDAFDLIATIPIDGRANLVLDDSDGDLWLERGISKIGRIHIVDGEYSYSEYGVEAGITSDEWIPIWDFDGEVLFTTRKGALRFNKQTNRFEVAKDFNALIPDPIQRINRPAVAPNGDLWISARDGKVILRKQPDGSFKPDFSTLQLLDNLQIEQTIFDGEDIVWFLSKKVLTRIDDRIQPPPIKPPSPQLTSVLNLRDGKLLDHFACSDINFPDTLAYSNNNLELAFNTPIYQGIGGVGYKHRLFGYSDQWTETENSSRVILNRIPSGKYEFQIKAIIADQIESPVTRIPIQIKPPFYGSIPAFFAYGILLSVIISLLLKFRHLKLVGRQKLLEEKVVLQTKALRDKNIQLHGAFLNERELKKKAEKANLVKSEFLAMVSHEIRTPMNCIIGMADNILATPLEKEQFEMLHAIHSSGQSLVAIISDILDFSKIEAGKIELENIPFSAEQAVRDVFNLFVHSCDEKNISLRTELPEEPIPLTIGDPVRLKQILINLVGNARKFTDQGLITISLKLQKRSDQTLTLAFTVQDTGSGIEKENMSLLFQAFSQIDSSNTRKFGGTGLGLAICKRILKLMEGDIGVSSELGHGSTFSFTILARLANVEEIEAYHKSNPKRSENTNTQSFAPPPQYAKMHSISSGPRDVLLVEDNPINQQVTAMMLRRIGFTCDIVGNGELACRVVAKKKYRVILMDIQMPEMDGIQCTRKILAENGSATPPIIAVTAKSAEVDREEALHAGMCGFLTKPIERPKLKEAIEEAIKNIAAKPSN